MKITGARVRPLTLPLRQPYAWSQGVRTAFQVNLIEIMLEDGTVGIGECTVAPDQQASAAILRSLLDDLDGESVFDAVPLLARLFQTRWQALGANVPRAANQMLAGIDFALWDAMGKVSGRPVHDLLGGALRDRVGYFFFLQGDDAEALARHAAEGAAQGERVFYLKLGRDEATDLAIVEAVRREIGGARLRLDANEAWSVQQAIRMARKLERYDIDFIEQPVNSFSLEALAHVRQAIGIPVVADQAAFTLHDVYEIARRRAADMICIGPREAGGIHAMLKVAAVCEAAGLPLCIHSSFTTGITTAAEHQIARMIPGLDDGNQIMWQLARDSIVVEDLAPTEGWLALPRTPGLGVSLNETRVASLAS
ncbi:MAG: mandelate racemase/muconate lactonizing enzyme family protein [Shimia sp.]